MRRKVITCGIVFFFLFLFTACKPDAPSNLTAQGSGTAIQLNWNDNSNNENGFFIYRRPAGSGSFVLLAVASANATSYLDVVGTCNGTFEYQVTSYNGDGESNSTNMASAIVIPCDPQTLTSQSIVPLTIILDWLDFSDNESGFAVDRSEDGVNWAKIGQVATDVETYTDSSLSCGTTYSYRVSAFNSAGDSGYSNVSSTSTLPCEGWMGFDGPDLYNPCLGPMGIDEGDIDKDGDLDIVLTCSESEKIVIMLNNGNGKFELSSNAPTETGWNEPLFLRDLDNDGAVDLIVVTEVYEATDTINVYWNNGDGTFGTPVIIATGESVQKIAWADFNGDDYLDFAVGNSVEHNFSVFINNQNQTFTLQSHYLVNAYVSALETGDLNGDNNPDLIVFASTSPYEMKIYLNDGSGYLLLDASYSMPDFYPSSLVVEDFDNDGDADVATVDLYSEYVVIYYNNGDGTYGTPSEFSIGDPDAEPSGIESGDLNEDGYADLIVSNEWNVIWVMFNNQDGSFSPGVLYNMGYAPKTVVVADLTGDGHLDIAVSVHFFMGVPILINNGSGAFFTAPTYPVDEMLFGILSNDLNNDGALDLIVSSCEGDSITVMYNDGAAHFTSTVSYDAGDCPMEMVLTTVNNDADIDLVVANADSDDIAVFINQGNGVFGVPTFYPVPQESPSYLEAADFNKDGYTDLAVTHFNNGTDVAIFFNNGDETFASPTSYTTGDSSGSVKAADIDADGDYDLAVANFSSCDVVLLSNNGDGTFNTLTTFADLALPTAVAFADLNADGDPDLIVNHDIYIVSIFISNGDGTFEPQVDYIGPFNTASFVITDLDNDGDVDLAGVAFIGDCVAVLLNEGDGTFVESWVHTLVGSFPLNLVGGDLDSDGDVDLAVTNSESDNISILANRLIP